MFFDEDMAATGASDAPTSDDGAMSEGTMPSDDNAGAGEEHTA